MTMDVDPYNSITSYNSVTASKEGLPGPSIVGNASIFDNVDFTSPRVSPTMANQSDLNTIEKMEVDDLVDLYNEGTQQLVKAEVHV